VLKQGQSLKHEREKRGWSQARLAELIDTDAGNVSRWERGFSSPSPYFREKLCKLYDKNAEVLGFLDEGSGLESGASKNELPESIPTKEVRLVACLSYLFGWATGLMILLFNRSNRFVYFHSLQSVCFFGIAHSVLIACWTAIPYTEHLPVVRTCLYFFGSFTTFVTVIAWIVAMIQAARGKYYSLPFVQPIVRRLLLNAEIGLAN
jgi:uncharacterized membrane protein